MHSVDTLTAKERSDRMSLVRSKNTKPELRVRSIVHRAGYRFRLHRRDLPGSPDLVFPSRRKVIFVHGCFWHAHPNPNCKRARVPKTRVEFWSDKFAKNRARDVRSVEQLNALGWKALTLWECELTSDEAIEMRVREFLDEVD